jgi:hypothetical protein
MKIILFLQDVGYPRKDLESLDLKELQLKLHNHKEKQNLVSKIMQDRKLMQEYLEGLSLEELKELLD